MKSLVFRDYAVPLSILFLCVALNVYLRENFAMNDGQDAFPTAGGSQYISGSSTKDMGGLGDLDRNADLYVKKSLSDLKTLSVFENDFNSDKNVDLTNWASFEPGGKGTNRSDDVLGSFAQVTNHLV